VSADQTFSIVQTLVYEKWYDQSFATILVSVGSLAGRGHRRQDKSKRRPHCQPVDVCAGRIQTQRLRATRKATAQKNSTLFWQKWLGRPGTGETQISSRQVPGQHMLSH